MVGEKVIFKVIDSIDRWATLQSKIKHKATKAKEKNRKKAIDSLLKAITVTSGYDYDLKNGSRRSRSQEQEISMSWRKAARNVYDVDRRFSSLLSLKAQGWADPELFKDPKFNNAQTKLDTIRKQLEWLQEQE